MKEPKKECDFLLCRTANEPIDNAIEKFYYWINIFHGQIKKLQKENELLNEDIKAMKWHLSGHDDEISNLEDHVFKSDKEIF
jgi:hypothetical protein